MDFDKESSEDESDIEYDSLDEEDRNIDFDISSDSDNESTYENLQNGFIYSETNISILDFAQSFLVLCKKLNIATSSYTIILQCKRTILPVFNKIPLSYTKLIKNLSFSVEKKSRICQLCIHETCSCNDINTKKIEIYEFDVAKRITCFVNKNWNTICSY
jgi:hypothetical protein